MAFDLDTEFGGLAEAQEKGIDVTILHPKTGEPIGMVVNTTGPDSKKQKAARFLVMEDRVAKGITKITSTRFDDEQTMTVANSINSWSGCVVAGETLDFSPENATKVFTRWPFIREQIQSAGNSRAGFIKV